jgi:predicted DNA-binding transcriptional regulator YafY
LNASARLLRLLSLLQARRQWTATELAERLRITDRTVRRDVERLRSLGYPVHATSGVAGGYRLGAGGALPPLLLDDNEAVAVAVGLRSAAAGSVAGIEEMSVRALAKLEQVLPPRLRQRIAAFTTSTVMMSVGAPAVAADTLTTIACACRDAERLRFDYRDRHGTCGQRTIEPHRLVHTGRRWYLVAYDLERGDWRTFRVDRIAPLLTTGPRFTPRDAPEATAYVAEAVTTAPYRYRARVRLHAPAATIAEIVPPTVATLDPIDAHSCVLTTGSDSLDMLALHLALHLGLIDVNFEVLDPPELVDRLHALADRLGRAARSSALPA